MSTPTVHQIAFSMIKGITIDIANAIIEVVGSEELFFNMSEKELSGISQINSKLFTSGYRESLLDDADKQLDFISKKSIDCKYFTDKNYPARFQTVPDAPLLIYSKGDCNLNSKRIISVVGTRHITHYGADICSNLVSSIYDEIGDDVVIVSGLAYGVDVAAHKAALKAGLPTVAVLAHGLDMIYPAAHRQVAADIIHSNGAIVTEYGCDTRIHRSNFLSRNRIIAALSDCTIVVESAEKGGALVTAKIAQGYGRDVFAYPGRIGDEYSEGCNLLIKKNVAALITSPSDIADLMGWKRADRKPIEKSIFIELTVDEQHVSDAINSNDGVLLNDLSSITKIPVHKLMSILFELEFKGVIRLLPGNRYVKIS